MKDTETPFGLHTITPYLIVASVKDLIPFLQDVFDAEMRGDPKVREDGSIMHAEATIGDSVVMMGEPTGGLLPMPATLYTYVSDSDATYKKALDSGAESVLEPADQPHGDRYGGVRDPAGNIWWIVTHIG